MPPKTVIISMDDSAVSRDALTWAAKAVVRPEDTVKIVSVLEPALRGDFNVSQESGLAYEGSEGVSAYCPLPSHRSDLAPSP